MADTSIGKLAAIVTADVSGFTAGMQRAGSGLQTFRQEAAVAEEGQKSFFSKMEKGGEGFDKLSKGLGRAIRGTDLGPLTGVFASLGAASGPIGLAVAAAVGIKVAVGYFTNLWKEAAEAAKKMDELAASITKVRSEALLAANAGSTMTLGTLAKIDRPDRLTMGDVQPQNELRQRAIELQQKQFDLGKQQVELDGRRKANAKDVYNAYMLTADAAKKVYEEQEKISKAQEKLTEETKKTAEEAKKIEQERKGQLRQAYDAFKVMKDNLESELSGEPQWVRNIRKWATDAKLKGLGATDIAEGSATLEGLNREKDAREAVKKAQEELKKEQDLVKAAVEQTKSAEEKYLDSVKQAHAWREKGLITAMQETSLVQKAQGDLLKSWKSEQKPELPGLARRDTQEEYRAIVEAQKGKQDHDARVARLLELQNGAAQRSATAVESIDRKTTSANVASVL